MGYLEPEWVKDAIFYQIFPDRFARTPHVDKLLGLPSFEEWETPPTCHGYKGGTLQGICNFLDYLQDLGINAIYLNPIFQSTSNHRYHTYNYFNVDPLLGGNEAFDKLLMQAHKKNMRVILDGVFNHVGRGFFPFNDLIENGSSSVWGNWFRILQWPIRPYSSGENPGYACWHNLPALPQLNHDNPSVREFLFHVAEHWLRKGIDGWRLDAPECIQTPGFWEEFRARVKAVNPEAYLVGEIVPEAAEWLDGNRFDGVTNYPLYGALLMFSGQDCLAQAHVKVSMTGMHEVLDGRSFARKLCHLMKIYPWKTTLSQLNFLENHDVPRFLTVVNDHVPALETALMLLFTLPGAPTVYYGGEVGIVGGDDPDCRRSFPQKSIWNMAIRNLYQKYIALRQTYSVLRTGSLIVLGGQEGGICYLRHNMQQTVLIAANASETPINLHFYSNSFEHINLRQTLFGRGKVHIEDRHLTVSLPPRGSLLVEGESESFLSANHEFLCHMGKE